MAASTFWFMRRCFVLLLSPSSLAQVWRIRPFDFGIWASRRWAAPRLPLVPDGLRTGCRCSPSDWIPLFLRRPTAWRPSTFHPRIQFQYFTIIELVCNWRKLWRCWLVKMRSCKSCKTIEWSHSSKTKLWLCHVLDWEWRLHVFVNYAADGPSTIPSIWISDASSWKYSPKICNCQVIRAGNENVLHASFSKAHGTVAWYLAARFSTHPSTSFRAQRTYRAHSFHFLVTRSFQTAHPSLIKRCGIRKTWYDIAI